MCTIEYCALKFPTESCSLKVHKIGNFFGSEFEFCTISLLVLLKYKDIVYKKI